MVIDLLQKCLIPQILFLLGKKKMHQIFNRNILRMHRDRAVTTIKDSDFLFQDSLQDITERASIYKQKYGTVLNIGSRTFPIQTMKDERGLEFGTFVNTDISFKMLQNIKGIKVQSDEEFIPFLDHSFDLVISNLNLHWVNDLPGTLFQIRNILKESGLFIASFFGENSLYEIKEVLIKTESDLNKNINFHISPTISAEMLTSLMKRAGFKDIVVDKNTITTIYDNPYKVLSDIRSMGESNCMNGGKVRYLRKDVLHEFSKNYFKMFSDRKGQITCSYDLLTCVGYR